MATRKHRRIPETDAQARRAVARALDRLRARLTNEHGPRAWTRVYRLAKERCDLMVRSPTKTTVKMKSIDVKGHRLVGENDWNMVLRFVGMEQDTTERSRRARIEKEIRSLEGHAGHKRSKKGATRKVSPAMKKAWAKGSASLKASNARRKRADEDRGIDWREFERTVDVVIVDEPRARGAKHGGGKWYFVRLPSGALKRVSFMYGEKVAAERFLKARVKATAKKDAKKAPTSAMKKALAKGAAAPYGRHHPSAAPRKPWVWLYYTPLANDAVMKSFWAAVNKATASAEETGAGTDFKESDVSYEVATVAKAKAMATRLNALLRKFRVKGRTKVVEHP
ncbi:MAG: hypothetical protein ACHREM_13575 [Polyangiales bacterium]